MMEWKYFLSIFKIYEVYTWILFGGDCVLEIAEAFCDEEDYVELLAEGDEGVGPGDPGV